MNEGFVVGKIHPAKSETERPEFEIIRRDGWNKPDAENRPCEHGKFILDEQWSTVTCGKCKEKVDPFSALMYYALNYQAVRRDRDRLTEAEKHMRAAELKRLSKLRDASVENREEIKRLTGWGYGGTAKDLREAARRIDREINERKEFKRASRRAAGCRHFRTHETEIVSDEGTSRVRYCDDCRVAINGEFTGATP